MTTDITDIQWIAPRLACGLGNRMFQTVGVIALAEQTNRKPVFLLPRTVRGEHGAYETFFSLFPKIPILQTANRWVEVQEGDRIPPTASLPEAKYGIVYKGFNQEHPIYPSLTSPYLPSLPPVAAKNVVGIHFRFGDYLQLPHHQVPLENYYKEALKLFPQSPLTLFSDQPELLQTLAANWRKEGRDVSIWESKDVYQTLLEIASCQALIGCNSTFGFWASWLAWRQNPNFKAVFPDIWMQEGHPNHKPQYLNTSFAPFIHLLRL